MTTARNISGHVVKTGYPRDLADAGPSSEVVTSFDPTMFEWDHEPVPIKTYGINIRAKSLYLTADAFKLLQAEAEGSESQDGNGYWVELGFAKRAIAMKLSQKKGQGYKVAPINKYAGSISCANFVDKLKKLSSAVAIDAIWDEKSRMLVAKLPDDARIR